MKLRFLLPCLLLCLLCAAGVAYAQVAEDITGQCVIEVSSNPEDAPNLLLADRSEWQHAGGIYPPYVEIATPEDTPAYGLYIVWSGTLHPGVVLTPGEADDWTLAQRYGTEGFAHEYIPLEGLSHFRISPSHGLVEDFAICQIIVLGEGETPDHIQVWQPPLEQADLMVIATHPDDELVFMGGTLPTYAGDRGVPTQVVYLTCSHNDRRSELLNGLWICGVRNYPVIGDFVDVEMTQLETAEMYWGREETNGFITEQLRRFKPQVVVTHDLQGEYGHAAHMLVAEATLEAVEDLVWDDQCFPDSAAAYGVHDVLKLYLHLHREGNRFVNWRQPLAAFGGETSLDVAGEAFSQHISQLGGAFIVSDTTDTSCASFGLAFTMVGDDLTDDDFMENVPKRK